MPRNVCTPQRPQLSLLQGSKRLSARALRDESKKLADRAYSIRLGKLKGVTPLQGVSDLSYYVEELNNASAVVLNIAKTVTVAGQILRGADPQLHEYRDDHALLECAAMVLEYLTEQIKAVPDYGDGDVLELASLCDSTAAKLRQDVSIAAERIAKIAGLRDSLIVDVLCDESLDKSDFFNLQHNTEAGRKLFAHFDLSPDDFRSDWDAAPKVLRKLGDSGLALKEVELEDGTRIDRFEYMKRKCHAAKIEYAMDMRDAQKAERGKRKAHAEMPPREQITTKLAEVWS